MVHKTKKYNRWKKIKDTKRRYTKKQNFYGGALPVAPLPAVATMGQNNMMMGQNNMMMGPNNVMNMSNAAMVRNTGYMVQPPNNSYKTHDSPNLNYVGETLDNVGSKLSSLNEGIQNFNDKSDSVKESIAKGSDKASSWLFDSASNIVNGLAESIDLNAFKQGSVAASIMIDAAEGPILEATKVVNQIVEQAASNAGTTLVNVVTDAATALPGVGAMIELPKVANDIVYGTAKNVEALTQLANIAGNIVDATKGNVDETIEILRKLKHADAAKKAVGSALGASIGQQALLRSATGQQALSKASASAASKATSSISKFGQQSAPAAAAAGGGFKNLTKQKAQIGGRINDSIAAFTDPIGYQSSILKGGNNNKTKKSFIKNGNVKSRRVHFSL